MDFTDFDAEDRDKIAHYVNKLSDKYQIDEIVGDKEIELSEYLERSILFEDYQAINYFNSFKLSNYKTVALLFNLYVFYDLHGGRYSQSHKEFQLCGAKKLPQDFGHIYIRPETMSDKLTEVFKKQEIDFKAHPRFSSSYYMIASDKPKAIAFGNFNRLDQIAELRGAHIEIKGNILLMKFKRVYDEQDALSMANFLMKI